MGRAFAVGVVAVLAVACGGGGEAPRPLTTTVDGEEVFLLHAPEGTCDDQAGAAVCARVWTIGSTHYLHECTGVADDQRDGRLYAIGVDGDAMPFAEARALPGLDPTEVVAVREKAGSELCPSVAGAWTRLTRVGGPS